MVKWNPVLKLFLQIKKIFAGFINSTRNPLKCKNTRCIKLQMMDAIQTDTWNKNVFFFF